MSRLRSQPWRIAVSLWTQGHSYSFCKPGTTKIRHFGDDPIARAWPGATHEVASDPDEECELRPDRHLRNADLVKNVCIAMEQSRTWTDKTEASLKPYEKNLTSQLVAAVVLQKPLAMARRFFDWAGNAVYLDEYAYHALLMKLGECRQFAEMWSVLQSMKSHGRKVSSTTLSLIIRAYGAAGMPHESMVVFSRAHEFNVALDVHMYTTLLSVLFKAKKISQARHTFERMLEDVRDVDKSAWATLIRGFGRNGCTKEAQKCWDHMLLSGCKPNVVHYNALIEGFCESKLLNKALFTLSAMQERGLKPNAYTFNPIIGALCKARRLPEALNIFFSLKEICSPNQATCNILLEGVFLNNDVVKACELFQLMEAEGLADTRSYVLLTTGLRKAKESEKLLKICKELHAKHGSVNTVVCNNLLQLLCEAPDVTEAVDFFNKLANPNVASYAMMINGYCKSGKLDEAMALLADMDNRGCEPNAFCYTPLFGAILRADRVSDGLKLFNEMVKRGIETNDITCGFLIRKLCQANMVDDVFRVCSHVMDNNISLGKYLLYPLIRCWKIAGRSDEGETMLRALTRQGCMNAQALKELDLCSDESVASVQLSSQC